MAVLIISNERKFMASEKLYFGSLKTTAGQHQVPLTPSTATPSTVIPYNVTPSTVTPSTVTPSNVTPSNVTPSTVTPFTVTPSTADRVPFFKICC